MSIFFMSLHQHVPFLVEQWAQFSFGLPFATDIGALLVGLHIPQQFQLQMSFVFPISTMHA